MTAPPPRAGAGAHRRPSPSRSAPLGALPEIDVAANPEKIQGYGEPFSSKLDHDRFVGGANRRESKSRSAAVGARREIDVAANPEKTQGDGEPFSSKLGHDRFGGGAKPDAPTDRINACRLALPSREVVLLLIGFPVLTSF